MDFLDKVRDGLAATFQMLLVVAGSMVFLGGICLTIGAIHFGDWPAVLAGCVLIPVGGVVMSIGISG